MNHFTELSAINVNDKVEKKNGLTYLSWAWAWGELKKVCPEANYTVYENKDGWNYHTDGKTCWVKTGVTADGIEHIEYLPIMDMRNKSIPADNVNSFDVNKAIQRSLTKAVARHGLGLYIYAGEDLPDGEEKETPAERKSATRTERVNGLCKEHGVGLDTFSGLLMSLKQAGEVVDKTVAQMTEGEFGVMLSLVHTALLQTKKTA